MELSNLYFMTDSTNSARHQMTVNPSFLTPPHTPHYPTVLDGAIRLENSSKIEGSRGRKWGF